MLKFPIYAGLSEGLSLLPLPENLKIGFKRLSIPETVEEFTENICYGQRLFLTRAEPNDIGVILRIIDGYYYPLFTRKLWDADKALIFGKKVLNCLAKELYPIAKHIVTLITEMAEREQKLLHREPTKQEKAAGIDKLNKFSELSAVDYLRTSMNKSENEVMLTPYNECLVRFMLAKETADFQERYMEEIKRESEPKNKYK